MSDRETRAMRETSPLLPTLSVKGWISGLSKKVDYIFSYYLIQQYNQTTHHLGHVRSLAYTVKNFGSEPDFLAKQIEDDLEFLFKPFFDVVSIDVTYEQRGETCIWDYKISLDIAHQGYRWRSFKGVAVNDSKFEEITTINNGTASFI